MFSICEEQQAKKFLNELIEYSYDPSPEFSRLAISFIWKLAIKYEDILEPALIAIKTIFQNSADCGLAEHIANEVSTACEFLFR